MPIRFRMLLVATTFSICGAARADITVPMNIVDEKGIGKPVGQVVISETPYGIVFTPSLAGLPPGLHGFHVHENPSCETQEKDGKISQDEHHGLTDQMQKLTDEHVKKVDDGLAAKEKEILQV